MAAVVTAVLDDVQRRLWSWRFFERRRNARRDFLDAYYKHTIMCDFHIYRLSWPDERDEHLVYAERRLLPADYAFYRGLGDRLVFTRLAHPK